MDGWNGVRAALGGGGGGEMKLLRLVGWFDMRDEMR